MAGDFQRTRHRPGRWELRRGGIEVPCYHEHIHTAFSIGHILEGRSTCHLAGQSHAMTPGSVVWIDADIPHCCNPESDSGWRFCMLYLEPAYLEDLGWRPNRSGVAHGAFGQTPASRAYDRWADIVFSDVPTATLAEDEAVLTLLSALPAATAQPFPSVKRGDRLQRAIDSLRDAPAEPWGLNDLAQLARMSPWQTLRAIRQRTGLTPHALQTSLRLEQARRWLLQGMPLAEAAAAAGFADQSHFTRMFKRHTAQTPGHYRQTRQIG